MLVHERGRSAGLNIEAELEDAALKIFSVSETMLGSSLCVLAQSGERCFSGDGASLLSAVVVNASDGQPHNRLVKLAWGEFSAESFSPPYSRTVREAEHNRAAVAALRGLSFPIAVVSQSESYFASDSVRQQMIADPESYLREHCLLCLEGGKIRWEGWPDSFYPEAESPARAKIPLAPAPYGAVLTDLRNAAVAARTSPDSFAEFLRSLPSDPVELGALVAKAFQERYGSERGKFATEMGVFTRLGTRQYGIAVGDLTAMNELLALKSAFDFGAGKFTYAPETL